MGIAPVDGDKPAEEGTRDTASVLYFDFEEQARTLFHDLGIFGDLNKLAVDPENPFGRYRSADPRLGEINSGARYDRTYELMLTKHPKEAGVPFFLCPLILYCDKTGTSFNQRDGLGPVMMTFSIIKERVRNHWASAFADHSPSK